MPSSLSVSFFRSAAEVLVLKRRRAKLGLSVRKIRAGGYTWSYLENSLTHPAIVVFIHGFCSEKDAWLDVLDHLQQPAHILIPDLPGHGSTKPTSANQNYGVEAQVQNLLSFLDKAVGPETPVHLVGHSMGGLIAGVFSAMFSHLVISLTLICPAGISMPKRSPVLAMYEDTGVNLMQATTVDEMQTLMQYTEAKASDSKRSRFLLSFYAKHQADRIEVVNKILKDMLPERTTLERHLHSIEADTIVLWGDLDQILDVSCVDRVKMFGMDSVVVAGCGHTIISRKPELCAAYVTQLVSRAERYRSIVNEMSSVLTSGVTADYI